MLGLMPLGLLVLLCLGSFPLSAQPVVQPLLAWDAVAKEVTVVRGQANAVASFSVTNKAKHDIVIQNVSTSCGCSVASLPAKPWKLAPGDHGEITVTTDLRGKRGVLAKSVFVIASTGLNVLSLKVLIKEPATLPVANGERAKNQEQARLDRQAVFKGDCAKCHAEPTKGKLGKDLFVTACGICHEAEHRASMVPDLKGMKKAMPREHWLRLIAHGKPGTLMPGFSAMEGGPLSEEQIRGLAEFLAREQASK